MECIVSEVLKILYYSWFMDRENALQKGRIICLKFMNWQYSQDHVTFVRTIQQ